MQTPDWSLRAQGLAPRDPAQGGARGNASMAIGYGRISTISRARGESICARTAYVLRSAITDPRTLQRHDYTRKAGDVEASGVVGWQGDAASLARAAAASETRANACEGRSAIFALPHELDAAARLRVVQRTCRDISVRHGVAVAYGIHRPGAHESALNWHVHILISSRRTEGRTFKEKARELDCMKTGGAAITAWREEFWTQHCNAELKAIGKSASVDMRSWKRRLAAAGLPADLLEPYEHLGPERSAIERKGRRTAAGDRNRNRRARRRKIEAISLEHSCISPEQEQVLALTSYAARKGQRPSRSRAGKIQCAIDSLFEEVATTERSDLVR